MEYDRPRIILLRSPVDFPHHLAASGEVGLHRLPVHQRIDRRIAVAREVAAGAADMVLVKLDVRIVAARAGQVERKREIPPSQPDRPHSALDQSM